MTQFGADTLNFSHSIIDYWNYLSQWCGENSDIHGAHDEISFSYPVVALLPRGASRATSIFRRVER